MTTVKKYLSLVKFSHTIFAMPFAMIGFFLGAAHSAYSIIPGWDTPFVSFPETIFGSIYSTASFSPVQFLLLQLLLVVLCMVFARSAAMAFNRWLDAGYDALNPRTAIREIPAGTIPAKSAFVFTLINCVLFIICTAFINKACFYLSPVALFVILFYSYTKRFTALCHLVLGVGLSLAPIGAYIAVTGVFNLLPILFSLAVLFWVSGFDIIYALQDEEFDKTQQLHSIPVALGKSRALNVSRLLHTLSATSVITAGIYGSFHWLYWIGVLVFAGMLVYQHSIVSPGNLSRVNIAFMTANGIASVVFAVFVIADLLLLK